MSRGKQGSRRKLVAAGVLVALTACAAGGLVYAQTQAPETQEAQAARTPEKFEEAKRAYAALGFTFNDDGTMNGPGYDPEVDKALIRKATAHAEAIRAKFKAWASKHRDIIETMMNAGADDEDAIRAVFDAVPGFERDAGLTYEDLYGSDPPFSWASGVKLRQIADYDTHKRADKTLTPEKFAQRKRYFINQLDNLTERAWKSAVEDFQDYRDFKIAESINSGRYRVQLWVSGRITQSKVLAGPPKTGRLQFNRVLTEAVPTYDFLENDSPDNAAAAEKTAGG